MKNKKLIFVLGSAASIAYFGSQTPVVIRNEKTPLKKNAEIKKEAPLRIPTSTEPKKEEAVTHEKKKNSRTQKGHHHPALPEGFIVLDNVFAVRNYHGDSAAVLEERNGFTFLHAESRPENSVPVVSDSEGKIYSLNRVVKLSGIDEDKRQDLIGRGLIEHYYHEGLKILYVEGPEDTLQFYEDLVSMELDPTVELNRNFNRAK